MKLKPFGTRDIWRIIITFAIVILIAIFVTKYSIWVLIGAIGVLVYTLVLEFIKFYLGLKNLKEKKFEIATIQFE